MKIERNSLAYRLIVPVVIAILTVSAFLIISINIISTRIMEEFLQQTVSGHVSETMRIMELAQADLVTSRLIDNQPVVEAKKRLVIEAISLNWQRRDISGAVYDEGGRPLLSNLPPEAARSLPLSRDSGNYNLAYGKEEIHGRLVTYPAWGWKIFIGARTPVHGRDKKEVFYLVPVVLLGILLMMVSFIAILRRKLQRPVSSLVSALGKGGELPMSGINELDRLSKAMNETMERLKFRTDELADELEERKKAEASLQQSEERYRTTLMSVGDAVMATDSEGRVMLMNQVAETLTGWSQRDAFSRPLEEVFRIVNEETGQPVENPVKKVLREGGIVGLANHTVLISRAGSECPIADAAAPIRAADGHTVGVVLVFRDQTVERATQNALREEKNKFEAIIAAMGDGVSIQDLNFRVLYQNEVHKGFVGSHAGEYCYKAYESMDAVCEGCPVALTFSDGMVHTVVRSVRQPSGTRYFEVTASPLKDASGKTIAGIEVVRDISQQRHNEELLRQSQKMEGIGQLAGGVAHDFNNLLTAIIGYTSLLELKLGDAPELKEYVQYILESTERASGLTKSLLAFSRKQPVEMKPLDINDLVCGFRGIIGRLIGEDIEIALHCSQEPIIVEADKGQIEQVLMNLVTNARDAMPKGGKIGITTERFFSETSMGDLPQGEYAVISVSDTGSGMDSSTLSRIFEPFFTTKEVGKGTGLGLSMAYGIISRHKGAIHVYSEQGQGTTFRIYLPLAPASVSADAGADLEYMLRGAETILLVEDNEDTRRVTKMILDEHGYSVIEAVDGSDAVVKFQDNMGKIDLVLCDLVMPKKNGKEACEEMKALRRDLKVILMSGYTADIIEQKGLDETGLNFISKPLNPSALLRKIREVLAA